jgi:hypothetical protein
MPVYLVKDSISLRMMINSVPAIFINKIKSLMNLRAQYHLPEC